MRISVITVSLNSKDTIEDTIKSVLDQSYPDIEHIVVDGCSTDGTKEVLSRYANRIAKIISEKDAGIYDALNKGILAATGEVIAILHSDDLYANREVLSKIAGIFKEEGVDSVYGDMTYVDRKNIKKIIRYWKAGKFSKDKLRYGWFPPHSSFFVKKHIYEKYSMFNTSFRIAADYDIMLRFLLKENISVFYTPKILVNMRMGGISNRGPRFLLKKSIEDISILKKHGMRLPLLVVLAKNISKIPQFI